MGLEYPWVLGTYGSLVPMGLGYPWVPNIFWAPVGLEYP